MSNYLPARLVQHMIDLVWSQLVVCEGGADFNFTFCSIGKVKKASVGQQRSGAHFYSGWTMRLCNEKMKRMRQKKARKWPHCWGLAVQMWDRTHFCHEENRLVQHVLQYQLFSVKRMSGGRFVCNEDTQLSQKAMGQWKPKSFATWRMVQKWSFAGNYVIRTGSRIIWTFKFAIGTTKIIWILTTLLLWHQVIAN